VKRRAWKIVLGLLAVFLLILGGIVLDVHRRAAAYLERERAEVNAARAAFLARDPSRPTASRDPVDGNAWDHYGPALSVLGAIPEELSNLMPEVNVEATEEDIPDEHAIYNLVLEYREPIAQLREGARCRSGRLHQQTLDAKDDLPTSDLLPSYRFLCGVIGHEHRMGRDEEALRTAAIELQLAQDYGRTGTLLSTLLQCIGEGLVCSEMSRIFSGSIIAPKPLEEFAATLDRLDATRPDFIDCWKGEGIFTKRLMLDTSWDELFGNAFRFGPPPKPRVVRPSWRNMFSERITRARGIARISECYERVEELRPLPSWKRIARAEALRGEFQRSGPHGSTDNEVLDVVWPALSRPFQRDAVAQLQRTLLRLSIAISRFDADQGRMPVRLEDLVPRYLPQVPVCPLTGLPLLYKDGKVWSVGRNLVDDGGVEDSGGNDDGGESSDVVWTVKGRK
jgi:hypothetical protein